MNEIYRIKRAIIENILSDLGRMQYTEDGQTPEYSYDAMSRHIKYFIIMTMLLSRQWGD